MSKPASRLFAALELLQSRRRVTGADMADALQVDRRTVRRYVAALAEMGIPFATERGRDGAYRLTFAIPAPPGTYRLRLAVAEAGGKVGALEIPVPAKLTPRLAASRATPAKPSTAPTTCDQPSRSPASGADSSTISSGHR